MSFTPRRSTRGAIFTPSAAPTTQLLHNPNATYDWISGPSTRADSPHTHYNAFSRVIAAGASAAGKKGKAKADQESRFTVGDGVLVAVEGGDEGIGILTRLWEEPEDSEDSDDEDDDGTETGDGHGDGDGRSKSGTNDEEKAMKMMGEVHWCFRRQDLPGIMKNLSVEDNEVLLAASPVRPVTTHVPVQLLSKTVPIYSRAFFREQFEPTKSVVKGWQYIRTGVYWCARAFDKGAKGGKVWRVDIDEWREGGKAGQGWAVPSEEETVVDDERISEFDGSRADSDAGADSDAAEGDDDNDDDDDDDDEGDEEEAGEGGDKTTTTPKKRKRSAAGTKTPRSTGKKTRGAAKGSKRAAGVVRGRKPKKVPHPKASASHVPESSFRPEHLPADPYERALRLLHVGATPESLPCREDEFIDVLSRVEEGVETGGGGCLYIAGVPGTGKTATVHAVVNELKRKAEDGELPPFSYVEINGLKIPTPQHAYTVLWEAISGAKNCSAKTALRGLEAHFGRKTTGVRGPRANTYVVLMDELDQLLTVKQDVVYNFFNWPTMRDSQLFVIAVANRMDLPQHLAAKIKSRLGLQTLLFQPYDRTSLIEIVQSRLIAHPNSTLDHKVLMPDAIALAATKMAGTNGDARRVLDACRRAVEVAMEQRDKAHPVTAREMMAVLNQMSSSPVAMFLKNCSEQQKMMIAAMVRCVRREGVPEISWRSVRTDHDALTRSLMESNDLLSSSELSLVFMSLVASHALTWAYDMHKHMDERKVALGMEIGEVGRVLMNEGEAWRRALAGV